MKRLECYIYGRVQMVMFRDFVNRKAKKLELVGFVQNMKDGSVKVIAEGEKCILKELVKKIKNGPLLSKVEKVKEYWIEPTKEFKKFEIKY